jgi:hypothetical protein
LRLFSRTCSSVRIRQLCSHGAIQFAVYEYLKSSSALRESTASALHIDIPAGSATFTFVLAGLSKMAAATATFPLSTVRVRVQQRPADLSAAMGSSSSSSGGGGAALSATAAPRDSMLHVSAHILRTEGVRGFFKGLSPCLLRVTPHSAVMLLAYERCLTAFQTVQAVTK